MSELQKWHWPGFDSSKGEYYRCADVEAARAADKARIEVLERAVEWCLENAAERLPDGSLMFHDPSTVVPPDLAGIIKAVKP